MLLHPSSSSTSPCESAVPLTAHALGPATRSHQRSSPDVGCRSHGGYPPSTSSTKRCVQPRQRQACRSCSTACTTYCAGKARHSCATTGFGSTHTSAAHAYVRTFTHSLSGLVSRPLVPLRALRAAPGSRAARVRAPSHPPHLIHRKPKTGPTLAPCAARPAGRATIGIAVSVENGTDRCHCSTRSNRRAHGWPTRPARCIAHNIRERSERHGVPIPSAQTAAGHAMRSAHLRTLCCWGNARRIGRKQSAVRPSEPRQARARLRRAACCS